MKELRDANLKVTKALPNGAASVTSDALDIGPLTALGSAAEAIELLLSAPALVAADFNNTTVSTDTATYIIQGSSDSAMGGAVTLADNVIVQTGGSATAAAAATARFRLPTTLAASNIRYIAFKCTKLGNGDASDKSGTLEVVV